MTTIPAWQVGQPQSGAGDQIIYYRKPNGWITWGDSLSGSKQRDFTLRGFEPLHRYGTINTVERDLRVFGSKASPVAVEFRDLTPSEVKARYIWEQILTHPDGPSEFPVEQIVAYRWYRPDNCPVPDAYFPQLQGHKIRELTCPEHCGRAAFVELDGIGGISTLRQHLRVMHEWDQANLQAYGERVGIDFNKADVEQIAIHDIEYDATPAEAVCEECGAEFRGRMAAAQKARHMRSHPVIEVQTI